MDERTYEPHDLVGAGIWSPLPVVESFIGSELTPEVVEQIKQWSVERRVQLLDRLATSVVGCIAGDQDGLAAPAGSLKSFSSIDRTWRSEGAVYALPYREIGQQLLYLPRILVPDPFARTLIEQPLERVARSREYLRIAGTLTEVSWLDGWLSTLCRLAPALREAVVQLAIPCEDDVASQMLERTIPLVGGQDLKIGEILAEASRAIARDLEDAVDPDNAFQLTVAGAFWKVDIPSPADFFRSFADSLKGVSEQEIWQAVSIKDLQARRAAMASQAAGQPIPWELSASMAMRGFYRSTRHLLAPALATNLALGSATVVGARSVAPAFNLFGLRAFEDAASRKQANVARTLSRFRLPGISDTSLEDVISIRKGESTFDDFRRGVGDLIDTVAAANPGDQAQFELELEQAVEDLLSPRISALKKSTKSSLFEKSFIPSGMAVGAGAIVYSVTGAFPVTAAVAAAVTPAGYLADRLLKRYRGSGRRDSRLVESFITLRGMTRKPG